MTLAAPRLAALGESALLITFAPEPSPEASAAVRHALLAFQRAALPEVIDVVPAYTTIALFLEPGPRALAAFSARAEAILTAAGKMPDGGAPTGRIVVIPVRYDGEDLDAVAAATGLTREEVITRHGARTYDVRCLGFMPGFAYLGDLDPSLALPRRPSPRTRVPPGSVAIAGQQTAVYPFASPGGWHLIGRTTLTMFDPQRAEAALLQPGDRVRFEPTT